jgi:hypothetical protein
MNRSRGVQVFVGGAIICLFVAIGNATAIEIQATSATLTPEVLKQIAEVESEIDRIEAQTINRLARTSTSALTPDSSKPMVTTATSRASKRSCTSTIRATYYRAAKPTTPAKARRAGQRRS